MSVSFNKIYFQSIASTSIYALENINNLRHLDVIIAQEQTAGHGQKGRYWHSPPGNLYLTIVLKKLVKKPKDLTILSSQAVMETLKKLRVKNIRHKDPNDVLVNDKKIAGILIKNIFRGDAFKAMMVSIGLNVNMQDFSKIDQPATSISKETSSFIEEEKVLEILLKEFSKIIK